MRNDPFRLPFEQQACKLLRIRSGPQAGVQVQISEVFQGGLQLAFRIVDVVPGMDQVFQSAGGKLGDGARMALFEHLGKFIDDSDDLFGVGSALVVKLESAGRFQSFAERVPPGSQVRPVALGPRGFQHEPAIEAVVLAGLFQDQLNQVAWGKRR